MIQPVIRKEGTVTGLYDIPASSLLVHDLIQHFETFFRDAFNRLQHQRHRALNFGQLLQGTAVGYPVICTQSMDL